MERGMETLHDMYANSFLISFSFFWIPITWIYTFMSIRVVLNIHCCRIFAYTPSTPQSILCHWLAQKILLRILTLAYLVAVIHSP